MRVLIACPAGVVADSVHNTFRSAGFYTYQLPLGDELEDLLRYEEYELLVLGGETTPRRVTQLRRAKITLPIIVVSCGGGGQTKANVLNAGADDCLGDTFESMELLARTQAVIRRSQGRASPVFELGNVKLNTELGVVEVDNIRVHFTAKEFQALVFFFSQKRETIIRRERLFAYLYPDSDGPIIGPRSVDLFIHRIRKKLKRAQATVEFETVRTMGWRFAVHLKETAAA